MKIIKSFIFLVLFTHVSTAQIKNFIDQPYIEVTGKMETEITPDRIYLKIIIDENDKKGKQRIEIQENQLINTLKSLGIDIDKNFSILDFDGYYQRKFFGTNGVTKIKHYQLIVNDGQTLGKVYKALDNIDISNISITRTDHSDIENIRRDTKLKALNIAKEKADQYAQAIGQSIGKALHIRETNSNNHANSLLNANSISTSGYAYKADIDIQDLNFKTITVSATVQAKFTLN